MTRPYATVDDVQARMPQFLLTSTSKPSIEQAQVFLDDAHAHLDGALSNLGYMVPVTGPISLSLVREAVSDRAICRILTARAAAIGTDVAFQSATKHCEAYTQFLTDLADPNSPIELTDALRTESAMEKPGAQLGGLLPGEPRICMDSRVKPMRDF
jgi:hypothetical protein